MNELLDAALEYVRAGLPVFPLHSAIGGHCSCRDSACKRPGKHPRTPNGFKDASLDSDTVCYWWTNWPDSPIGVPTGILTGIIVLDIDPRHGGDESLSALITERGGFKDHPVVKTGGGGRHFWFAHPGGTVPNAGGFRPGLDVRGDGGYVIVPPSLHHSGGTYSWVVPPSVVKPPMPPPWLLEVIEESHSPEGRRFEVGGDGKIPHGRHHDFIVQTAASFASRIAGIGEDTLVRQVRGAIKEALDDADAHEQEIIEAARSALVKYGRPPPPGEPPPTPLPAPPVPSVRAAPALPPPVPIPQGLFTQNQKTGEWKPDYPAFVAWFRKSDRFVVPVDRGTFSTGSNFELLRYEGGYYNGMARAFIRGRTEDAFRTVGEASVDAFREEVVKGVAATSELHRRRTDFNPPDLLCLQNGVLDTRGGLIGPHSPDVVFTWRLPVAYDPAATCPRFVQFLEEVMPDERRRELLVDLMGYCLWRENPFQLFFVLVGDGANGKTTYGRVLGALLGKDAVSTLSLQQIGSNRFAGAELEGRLVNLCDDLPYDKPLAATGVLKVLTGGGTLTVERKHQHPFDLLFGGKLVSMANRTPPTQDDTYAFWRRAVVMPFEQVFPKDDPRRDPLLFDRLVAELPGILNLALAGLARVRSRPEFDPKNLFSDGEEEWRRRADPIRAELLDDFEPCPGAFVTNARLYEWHVERARNEDRDPLKERAFGQYVTHAFPMSRPERKMVNGKNTWGRPGIRERVASPVLGVLDIDAAIRKSVTRGEPKKTIGKPPLAPATAFSREGPGSSSPVLAGGSALVLGKSGGELGVDVRAPARTGDEGGPQTQEERPTKALAGVGSRDGDTGADEEVPKPPPGAPSQEEVDAVYDALLDTLRKRGDTIIEFDRLTPYLMHRGHGKPAIDATVGRMLGSGLLKRSGEGWVLKEALDGG